MDCFIGGSYPTYDNSKKKVNLFPLGLNFLYGDMWLYWKISRHLKTETERYIRKGRSVRKVGKSFPSWSPETSIFELLFFFLIDRSPIVLEEKHLTFLVFPGKVYSGAQPQPHRA